MKDMEGGDYEVNWWLVCLFWVVLIILLTTIGCDDPGPDVRYLGPPVVQPVGDYHLDAWEVGDDSSLSSAAFGWTVEYDYMTGSDSFRGPGIRTTMSPNGSKVMWGPKLGRFARATGCESETDGDVVGVSADDGITWFCFGLEGWPEDKSLQETITLGFHARGMSQGTDAATEVLFGQTGGYPFMSKTNYGRGAYWTSWQARVYGGAPLKSMPTSNSLVLNPVSSAPRVLVADIQPVLAECAKSVTYPPYSDPNAHGADILIRSRWMQAKTTGGEWTLEPVDFITALPADSNDTESMATAAWPYSVSFHVPAESKGLGIINARLSIVDPNGALTAAIDMKIHEVGQCINCTEWLWRSGYVIPLTQGSNVDLLEADTAFGPVIAAWLPRGYNLKIRPVVGAKAIYILSAAWLAEDSVLDLDGNGVVNFKDYSVLLGMK